MFRVLHLCGSLMNLYGESGNIKMLKRRLKAQNIELELIKAMPGDVKVWGFDLIYMGSATEKSLFAALLVAREFKDELASELKNGAVVLATGNAVSLLGSKIIKNNQEEVPGLGLLDLETIEDYEHPTMVDCVFESKLINQPIVGFINRATNLKSKEEPLFEVKLGVGNSASDKFEGAVKENIFATHLIGPILVKNPEFLELIMKRVAQNSKKFEYQPMVFAEAQKAYEVTLLELRKRIK